MKREGTLEDISDGKRYAANDMVKVGCSDCKGCSDCCYGMGDTIQLDPFDIFRMEQGIGKSFEVLLKEGLITLSVIDGMILPHIAMRGEKEACGFLNEEDRCSIHPYRSGICRLFPLGRIYENGGFSYFMQTDQCSRKNRTKVRIKSWIDTPETAKYERYICDWHYFLKNMTAYILEKDSQERAKKVNMFVLHNFYVMSFQMDKDFYEQFENRLCATKKAILGEMI